MADIVPAHAVEMSHDAQTDATDAYGRLTHIREETAIRLHNPSRYLVVGERSYDCTVTLNEYYRTRNAQ